MIRGLNLPGTPWATSACCGRPLLYKFESIYHILIILGTYAKLWLSDLSSPSICVKRLGYCWTDFHEIWYLSIFRNSVNKIRVWLKSDKDMTRGADLMQQLWFIIINYFYMFQVSICPSSGVQVVCYCMWCSALGVAAVIPRSRREVLCTVCKLINLHTVYVYRSLCKVQIILARCMCDRASCTKMTSSTNLMQQLWFIIIYYLYMFQASMCPSSGVQVVCYCI